MNQTLVQSLRDRRSQIKREWGALLRTEPMATPLGHPEALTHLVDRTLDEIFQELGRNKPGPDKNFSPAYDSIRQECACDRNPLLAYFLAGERALLEALVQSQAARADRGGENRHTDLAELYLTLRRIARREVKVFCSLCQHVSATGRAGAASAPETQAGAEAEARGLAASPVSPWTGRGEQLHSQSSVLSTVAE